MSNHLNQQQSWRQGICAIAFVLLSKSISPVAAFAPNQPRIMGTTTACEMASSRREWISKSFVGLTSAAFVTVGAPSVASADVTNKVASTSALRNVKRAQKQLDSIELYVVNSQFQELKEAVRVTPLSEIRKNCFVIIRGGEDGPDADKLNSSYKSFIQSLEQMDSVASLGIRGRDITPEQLSEPYKSTVAALADFVKVAEEAVEIPLSSSSEGSS